MSKPHRIDLPRVVIIGERVIESLGEVCHEFGFKSVITVTGHQTFEVAGRQASEILDSSGLRVEQVFVNNANITFVNRVVKQIKESSAEVVVGVGGGRVIDIAKLGSARSKTPFISVPTAASHDGIASKVASIKGLDRPYSVVTQSPIAVIADSEIVAKSPYRFTASGCGDVLAKSVSVRDWKLGYQITNEYYGEYAASLALMSADLVMRSAEDIRSRKASGIRTLLEALVSCGVAMSIAGSSRPCSGSEHLFSHALDIITPNSALHGEKCGVGTIMMAKLCDLDWKLIRDKLRTLGAPTTSTELGIEPKHIIEAVVKAKDIRSERYTILNKVNLTWLQAKALAESCGVI